MCNNYAPIQRRLLHDVYGVEPPSTDYPPETWPDYAAPIIQANQDGTNQGLIATFGMIPKSRIPPDGKKFDMSNARSETIREKRSFAGAWANGLFCLVPATSFYEPNYEGGAKSVRWRTWLKDEADFAIAGLWRTWPREVGAETFSFTMLTINSDKRPLMSGCQAEQGRGRRCQQPGYAQETPAARRGANAIHAGIVRQVRGGRVPGVAADPQGERRPHRLAAGTWAARSL